MNILTFWIEHTDELLKGLQLSIEVTAIALVIGMPLGLLLALSAMSKISTVKFISVLIIEIGRGAPSLVVLQIAYFGLPSIGLSLTSFVAAAAALAVTTAAYTSEIIRGGLQSVPESELEASAALGLRHRDTLRFIVIPQGLRVAIPALMSFSILILQASSLAFTIALPELMSAAYTIGSNTFRYLDIFILAGLMYAAITIPGSWMSNKLERSLSKHL